MMQTLWLSILLAVGVYMDTFLLNQVNIYGIRPDMLLAVIASAGVLLGGLPAAITGGIIGLMMDVLFGKLIGLNGAAFVIAGAVGGMFYRKFYADNTVIPAVCAVICAVLKEHIMAIGVLMRGGTFSYTAMLVRYILPSALLTGLICVPVHALLKWAGNIRTRRPDRIAVKR